MEKYDSLNPFIFAGTDIVEDTLGKNPHMIYSRLIPSATVEKVWTGLRMFICYFKVHKTVSKSKMACAMFREDSRYSANYFALHAPKEKMFTWDGHG